MKLSMFAMCLGATALAQAAPDGQALAAQHSCLACHAVDHRILGPAYKDVAARYKNDRGAEQRLMAKVKSGGAGVWGQVPMPPQAVGDADLKLIVDWVLSQK